VKSDGPDAVVSSYNDWDPLEEVIVGTLDGACVMPWEVGYEAVVPNEEMEDARTLHVECGGMPLRSKALAAAQEELNEFVRILQAEGVTVRRPDPIDFSAPYSSPFWSSPSGSCQANPRDVLVVIGDEIIEATMSLRSRYFEFAGYRRLIKEYFRQGARWTAAPKPLMTDDLYRRNHKRGVEYVTTEVEPVFDAADLARCGRDIFVQRSHVTNLSGIQWLQRHLGDGYRIHPVEFDDYRAVHIDATFVPLAPGKLMVNPDRPIKGVLPEMFKRAGWEVLVPPRTTLSPDESGYWSHRWLHINVLMLDEQRVMVESSEEPMIRALKEWGFKPIPCKFRNNYRFGGSFHCATCDIRRRGPLRSYF
jgi:glycine amidinotransferase